jgi:acyl carrier protein
VTAPAPGAETVLSVVRAAVARVLEVDPATVTATTSLRDDLAADSLALVEIAEIVEEELSASASAGFRIDDEDLERIETVGDAVDYAVARLSGRSS